jgi:hypothetical protein
MKEKEFLFNSTKSFFLTIIIGILILSLIILATKYLEKRKNILKDHQSTINKIENQINHISFDLTRDIENQKYYASFTLQTNNLYDAQNIKQIIENSNIVNNKNFSIELEHHDASDNPNRKNLLHLIFESDAKYNPKFQNIIHKLINSEYKDEKYNDINKETKTIQEKRITHSSLLTNDEIRELEIFDSYKDKNPKCKYIDLENFAEFILICQKNQKPNKKLDKMKSRRIDGENSLLSF